MTVPSRAMESRRPGTPGKASKGRNGSHDGPVSPQEPEQSHGVNGHGAKADFRNGNWKEQHNARIASGERIEGDFSAAATPASQRGQRIKDPRPQPKSDLGVIDPRDPFSAVPVYTFGQLPKVFEDYVRDCVASWGGDPGPYACAFLSVGCGVLHSTVKMNTNPDKPDALRNPNDHSLGLGTSGANKSGLLRDLMRRQESWHAAAAKHRQATATATTKRGKGIQGPRVLLQRASVEGALAQIADNKGERLIITTEEAMGLLKGAEAHPGVVLRRTRSTMS